MFRWLLTLHLRLDRWMVRSKIDEIRDQIRPVVDPVVLEDHPRIRSWRQVEQTLTDKIIRRMQR